MPMSVPMTVMAAVITMASVIARWHDNRGVVSGGCSHHDRCRGVINRCRGVIRPWRCVHDWCRGVINRRWTIDRALDHHAYRRPR